MSKPPNSAKQLPLLSMRRPNSFNDDAEEGTNDDILLSRRREQLIDILDRALEMTDPTMMKGATIVPPAVTSRNRNIDRDCLGLSAPPSIPLLNTPTASSTCAEFGSEASSEYCDDSSMSSGDNSIDYELSSSQLQFALEIDAPSVSSFLPQPYIHHRRESSSSDGHTATGIVIDRPRPLERHHPLEAFSTTMLANDDGSVGGEPRFGQRGPSVTLESAGGEARNTTANSRSTLPSSSSHTFSNFAALNVSRVGNESASSDGTPPSPSCTTNAPSSTIVVVKKQVQNDGDGPDTPCSVSPPSF